MTSPATPAYDELTHTFTRMHHLGHLQSMANWDQAANMPPKGNAARAAALAEMSALLHRMQTDPALGQRIEQAAQEPLSDPQRANLREIRRGWLAATTLPESLVQLFEHDRHLDAIGRGQGIQLQRVLAYRQVFLVRGAGDGPVDAGELATVFLVPLPDGGRGVGGRIIHASGSSKNSHGRSPQGHAKK